LLCPDPCGGQVVAGGKAPAGGGECQRCERVFESADALLAAGGASAHLCAGRGQRLSCKVPNCGRAQAALCDYPVEKKGKRGTCDFSMCETHRTKVGPNRDHCPAHVALAKQGAGSATP
jgi:hypothetical protein